MVDSPEPKNFSDAVEEQASQTAQLDKERQQQQLSVANAQAIIDSIGVAINALVKFQTQHEPNVSVKNQPQFPTSIKTPDIQKVVKALENLKPAIIDNKADNSDIIGALEQLKISLDKLPTEYPEIPTSPEEITVKNQPDYKPELEAITKAVKAIDVRPIVNIPEDKPDDYTPIIEALNPVIEAIKTIKIPEVPTTDLSPLISATNLVQETIQNLRFPTANYILPFKDSQGKATQVQLDSNGNVPISSTGLSITNDGSFATPARQDTGNVSLSSLDSKIPALGQAVSNGSSPVVLPSAQITALTPPAAITGFAKESGGNLDSLVANQTNSTQKTQVTNFPVTQPISGSVTANTNLAPTGTALNTYSIHLTSNGTTTPTSSTAYISSIVISNEVGGTTSTITIQDKQGTPLKLINGLATTALTTAPTVANFQTPVKMVGGIDVLTAGAVAATVDIWINYYQ